MWCGVYVCVFTLACVCECMHLWCTCLCACAYTFVWVHTCGGLKLTSCAFLDHAPLYVLRQIFSSEPSLGICSLCFPSARITGRNNACSTFDVGSKDLNFQAFTVNTLPTQLSPCPRGLVSQDTNARNGIKDEFVCWCHGPRVECPLQDTQLPASAARSPAASLHRGRGVGSKLEIYSWAHCLLCGPLRCGQAVVKYSHHPRTTCYHAFLSMTHGTPKLWAE